ncbi:regulatory solute carrier protein family 1 member 1 isoform X2 [Prionailurus bengalensis]|uniref:regulatory solute carrier protein family 1 member 1 isoform X2 n=1 Tax=Prionailurus bengalensis TaxID=37029 RepID=UPI001CA9A298|nr:regulatory solute carrier protein family 1 member 1 isoform X2 [Prionailurus bengalensis]
MLLTVYCVRRDLSEVTFSLQVDADFELHNFRALCELESGIPAAESQIVYAERPLTDNHRSLASYGLKDGDVVILRQKENADPRPPVQFPKKFSRVLEGQQQDRARREQERIRLFSADPFDLEAQAKIEEDIRQQNIEENMTIAMEEAPESFGQVVMLYINCKVNGHPVKAFVDSGAQMTIMSQACAERCNIMRLVDRRWAGIAKGVGTQKIIGRVHLAQVQIEGDFLACSFSILEEQPMDMLLGLDMLKRHQCSIDLKKNVLVIGTTGSQTTFLPEGELPECARLAYGAGREDVRPEEIADQELAEALQKSVEDAEKSGKETTSLGMSSLPTSDGFNHPAHPSGQSPEIGNPMSLAHSVSASGCPIEPSDPDSIEPKALKALKASAEFQITSEKKEHLPPQDLSDCASSADSAPAMPLQNSSEEAIVAENMAKSAERSTQGLRSPLHTRQQASLSVTTTSVQEPPGFLGEKGWHPESQNPSQGNGLQQHKEPGNEQHEVVQQNALCDQEQEHLCNTEDFELLGERQQNPQRSVDLEATVKEDRLQQNVDLPGTEENILPSGCFGCPHSETLMEVDTVEESLVAVPNSADGQNANVKNIGAPDLTLDNPLMEVETSKCNPSSEILSNSICTQDLQLPDNNVEMSGTNKEDGDCSPSLSLCGSCQPSVESAEESCSSLTAALKELHELLVISSKPASENTSEEVLCQSEMVTEGQTGVKDLSERWTQSEHVLVTQNEERSQVSFHQTISVSVRAEKLTDTSNGAGVEDVENINVRDPGDGLVTDKESVPESRESENKSSSDALASAKTSNQLHCTLGVEISPKLSAGEEDGVSPTSEQTKSWSNFTLVEDLGQGAQSPVTDRPETRQDVCPEAAGPLVDFEPPTSHPSSSPSILPPLIFPAADIDRILRAGFTLQEALGALHRVGGNADLALLVLLAKNIVVPT